MNHETKEIIIGWTVVAIIGVLIGVLFPFNYLISFLGIALFIFLIF